jgi:methyl-CpG-binding domain protein 4
MMLNCTKRKQVEPVMRKFISFWPTPDKFLLAELSEVEEVCRSLGFVNRRSAALMKMTHAYVNDDWTHASQLPGVGAYAPAAWELFVKGIVRDDSPNDHALALYHKWRKHHVDSQKISGK